MVYFQTLDTLSEICGSSRSLTTATASPVPVSIPADLYIDGSPLTTRNNHPFIDTVPDREGARAAICLRAQKSLLGRSLSSHSTGAENQQRHNTQSATVDLGTLLGV